MCDAQAERLVAQFEEAGVAVGDLGLAFLKIAKYEDEEGARTGAYTDSSAAAKDISANTKRVGMVRPHVSRDRGVVPRSACVHACMQSASEGVLSQSLRTKRARTTALAVHALWNELQGQVRWQCHVWHLFGSLHTWDIAC